ncbi:hypothetical protein IV64_GL001224 [Lactiplantibacillus xiangfangensis]|uniref:Uncharacterized protein n=1 Tax=Lactiplantibacillus xiangfangensis TaxID=942150 RepID=A0A0R2MAS3_9LACO|nr:hypothetical protein IV64_GL001224 [Lactiplantibacillus xiangfangensis]
MSINVESGIIPGLGMVADSGLSETSYLLAHVTTIMIENTHSGISEWVFYFYPSLFF